jgi:hypothetical protein
VGCSGIVAYGSVCPVAVIVNRKAAKNLKALFIWGFFVVKSSKNT